MSRPAFLKGLLSAWILVLTFVPDLGAKPRKIIFDTDWWTDIDDACAVRILLDADRKGTIDLKGICLSAIRESSVPSLDAFLNYEGAAGIPLGADKQATDYNGKPSYHQVLIDSAPHSRTLEDCQDCVPFYRQLLAESEDKVDIIAVGYPNALARLLESGPDQYSRLDGVSLVRRKVRHLWMMAGLYPGGSENNFNRTARSRAAGALVCSRWPSPVTFLGYEAGIRVVVGGTLPENDLLHRALAAHGSAGGRFAWDPMTTLMAIEDNPSEGYDIIQGVNTVDPQTGENVFTPQKGGKHGYVVMNKPDEWYVSRINRLLERFSPAPAIQNVAKYIGKAEVSKDRMDVRNRYYWSVGTEVNGLGHILGSRMVHSCGISQADYRLCTYEDGSPIIEDGKLFFCMSCRMSGIEPKVASYDISTCQFKLIGAIQGMQADTVRNAIAPHILYNRKDSHWYVFAHWGNPHNLCVSKCVNDPRYGYNEIEFQLLDYAERTRGDEDNFVYYDENLKRWVLIYSRGSTTLARQESESIDGGYGMVTSSDAVKTLTGINVTTIGGKKYIISGYGKTPDNDAYKVFDINTLQYVSDLNLDIPTGGWRGWGTILALPEGQTTRYQLLTFDRVNPTGFNNWQYGTMYLYEARERGCVAPGDLHFVRKFAQRNTYNMELVMGKMDFSFEAFLPKSNPYPVMENEGVSYAQVGESIEVKGKGRLALLGGTHCPCAEYVLDLSRMASGETRFLRLGTMTSSIVNIRFRKDAEGLRILSGDELLYTVPGQWDSVRIVTTGTTACFIVK